ncbi:MAG TPA: hypothetical protein VF132_11160 [Rudaea sp.]
MAIVSPVAIASLVFLLATHGLDDDIVPPLHFDPSAKAAPRRCDAWGDRRF